MVSFKFSEEEVAILDRDSKTANMNKSEYVRWLLRTHSVKVALHKKTPKS